MTCRISQYSALPIIVLSILVIGACTPAPLYRGHSKDIPPEGPFVSSEKEKSRPRDVDIILQHPLGGAKRINSPFGIRTHPSYGTKEFHQGVDFEAESGDDVYAAATGRVIYAGRQRGYGKVIIIDHGNGMTSLYAHLIDANVRKGEDVHAGQQIGRVGVSGNATGSHLHFELRISGEAVDPLDYMEIK